MTDKNLGIVNSIGGSEPFADFTPYQATLDAWTAFTIAPTTAEIPAQV